MASLTEFVPDGMRLLTADELNAHFSHLRVFPGAVSTDHGVAVPLDEHGHYTVQTHLTLSWGVSRGRDTYGYNIRRLRDDATGKRYRCMGGGYDMTGTVFGEWLQDVYQDRLVTIRERAGSVWRGGEWIHPYADRTSDALYGMRYYSDERRVALDGACGESAMKRVAEALGLSVESQWTARGDDRHVGYVVRELF